MKYNMQSDSVFLEYVGRDETQHCVEKYVTDMTDNNSDNRTKPKYCGLAGGSGTGKSRALIELIEKVKSTLCAENCVVVPLLITFNSGMTLYDEENGSPGDLIETSHNIKFHTALRLILS